jgi:hypothetical protein
VLNKPQVELILTRAIDSLAANGVTPDRDMWLKQAEEVRTTTRIRWIQDPSIPEIHRNP